MQVPLALLFAGLVHGFVDYGFIHPTFYTTGNDISIDAHNFYRNGTISLSPHEPVLTLDYGTEVAGFPYFDVLNLTAPTQIEVKYAESFVSLGNPNSDGPWTFNNGLSSSFRVETFNLSSTGFTQAPLLQGGQRWQTIHLLTNTTVQFAAIGFNSTASNIAADEVPGKLRTSNEIYNKIFDLGSRVAQVACVDAGNAPSTWQVTDEGVYIPAQQTAQYVLGTDFANYTLTFSTKIARGGTGWRVASGTSPYGAVFYLTSTYPEETTFLNTNTTLLPANALVFNYGYSIVNQTTLETGWNQYFPLNTTIHEQIWYTISTSITPSSYDVYLDSTLLASVPIFEASFLAPSAGFTGTGSAYTGTFGFGPWNGQEALISNVSVTSNNGSTLYSSPMTLASYSIAPLSHPVCLDGGKRDRLVWIGDFYHTVKILASSTQRWDFILGTIDYVFSFQKKSPPYEGFVPISAALGTRPEYAEASLSNYAGLNDYQDLFVAAIGEYFWRGGDVTALRPYWSQVKKLVDARMGYIDPYSGLVAGEGASYFLGPSNGSAVTGLFAYALRSLIPLATALNDSTTADLYSRTATNLSEAINTHLWNPSLGTYSLSLDAPANYSLTSIAWTILSGTANTSQVETMLSILPSLRLGVGYKTSSSDPDDETTQLSPNILGFLLEALFKAHRDLGISNTTIARSLLDDFWSQMVTQNEYYSGASWEYLYPDGSPGIDLFTSLAHPWGAAPTYVLPEYVLGIRATAPGYKKWEFEPLLGILGLEEVNGTVGGIEAGWKVGGNGTEAVVWVEGPHGTSGVLVLPEGVRAECEGQHVSDSRMSVVGGKKTEVRLHGLRV